MEHRMAVLGVRGNTWPVHFGRRSGDSVIQPKPDSPVGQTQAVREVLLPQAASSGADRIELTPVTPDTPVPPVKPKMRSIAQQIFRPLKRTMQIVVLGWAGIWGAATGYDAIVGDGPPPTMHALPAPSSVQAWYENSTIGIALKFHQPNTKPSPQECWDSLAQTRELLTQFSPEVSAWLEGMNAQGRIHYSPSSKNLAFFDVVSRDLNLHDGFFAESDRHKLAIITHEYWHSRQNAGKHIARLLSPKTVFGPMVESGYLYFTGRPLCEPGFTAYGSQVEDEAHQLERQASILLGIGTSGPDDYFRERGMPANHSHKH